MAQEYPKITVTPGVSRAQELYFSRARVEDARQHPELVTQLAEPEDRRIVERLFVN